MKNHLLLKLNPIVPLIEAPYWQDIIADKSRTPTLLHPAIDALFNRYHLPIWVTSEYRPFNRTWDHAEIASGLNRMYRLILQQEEAIPAQLIHAISLLPMVEYVEIGHVAQTPLPSSLPMQMDTRTDRRSRDVIYLDEARRYTRGHPDITIAILDTGVSLAHPELKDNVRSGYDFVNIIDGADSFLGDYLDADADASDEVGHGTHVAGILVAKGLAMPSGIVPRCKILPVRVLGSFRRGNERIGAGLVHNINDGIKWAVDHGADVLNMSLGIRHTGGGLPHAEVVKYAQQKGVTIVAASGNDGTEQLYYPGALPYVITVGAVDDSGKVATFSTYGQQVDFVAPGTNIYSTYLDNDYAFSTGTSHATPFVTGAVALLKSYALEKAGVHLSDRQVKHILKHTADKPDTRFKNRKSGYGTINLIDGLRYLEYRLEHTVSYADAII